jgi:hypothetical protein
VTDEIGGSVCDLGEKIRCHILELRSPALCV